MKKEKKNTSLPQGFAVSWSQKRETEMAISVTVHLSLHTNLNQESETGEKNTTGAHRKTMKRLI